MDSVSTMNLNEGGDSSMTPFFQPAPEQRLVQKPQETQNLVYQPNVEFEKKPPEKNISKSKAMDSTPLSDVMMSGDDYAGAAGGGPDPRYMMAPQPSYVQQQMPVPQGYNTQPQKPASSSKNPLNLTDEQMEALLAGAAALLAFSGVAQEKLSTIVPKFLDEFGKRSMMGSLVTALLVAIMFYFGRRFVIRD